VNPECEIRVCSDCDSALVLAVGDCGNHAGDHFGSCYDWFCPICDLGEGMS
jgi:hypothetical protein